MIELRHLGMWVLIGSRFGPASFLPRHWVPPSTSSQVSEARLGKPLPQYGKPSRSSDEPGAARPGGRVLVGAGARQPYG